MPHLSLCCPCVIFERFPVAFSMKCISFRSPTEAPGHPLTSHSQALTSQPPSLSRHFSLLSPCLLLGYSCASHAHCVGSLFLSAPSCNFSLKILAWPPDPVRPLCDLLWSHPHFFVSIDYSRCDVFDGTLYSSVPSHQATGLLRTESTCPVYS